MALKEYKKHFLDEDIRGGFFVQCTRFEDGKTTHVLGFIDPMTQKLCGGKGISKEVFDLLKNTVKENRLRKTNVRKKLLKLFRNKKHGQTP